MPVFWPLVSCPVNEARAPPSVTQTEKSRGASLSPGPAAASRLDAVAHSDFWPAMVWFDSETLAPGTRTAAVIRPRARAGDTNASPATPATRPASEASTWSLVGVDFWQVSTPSSVSHRYIAALVKMKRPVLPMYAAFGGAWVRVTGSPPSTLYVAV